MKFVLIIISLRTNTPLRLCESTQGLLFCSLTAEHPAIDEIDLPLLLRFVFADQSLQASVLKALRMGRRSSNGDHVIYRICAENSNILQQVTNKAIKQDLRLDFLWFYGRPVVLGKCSTIHFL